MAARGRPHADGAQGRPHHPAARRLLRGHQLLVELLARAQAGEHDRDVALGHEPGHRDHEPGEVEDADGLAHLQDAQVAVVAEAGQQHEAHGLADRHEVAAAVGVGDRHRPAGRDLRLEQRHHAARAAQHVAEAHDGEARRRSARACVAHDQLGEALGRAHDARRARPPCRWR